MLKMGLKHFNYFSDDNEPDWDIVTQARDDDIDDTYTTGVEHNVLINNVCVSSQWTVTIIIYKYTSFKMLLTIKELGFYNIYSYCT